MKSTPCRITTSARALGCAMAAVLAIQMLDVREASAALMVTMECLEDQLMLGSAINSLPAEPWSADERAVYDTLSMSPSTTQLSPSELEKLGSDLRIARARLGVAFPETQSAVVRLEYHTSLLMVRFSDPAERLIEELAPRDSDGRPVRAVRRVRFPIPFSEALGPFCRKVCQCWLEPFGIGAHRMYFGRGTSLMFALRELRKIPEVVSVGLSRGVYYQPDDDRDDPSHKISARILPDGFLFALSTTDPSAKGQTTYYKVRGDKVHRLSTAEVRDTHADAITTIPADVWGEPTP